MQQDNTIETALRQLESQQLPDMSHADAHWQQMQAMLHPATAPAKRKYWPWLIVAACFLGGVVLLVNNLSDKKQADQTTITVKKQEAAQGPTDTVPKAQLVHKSDTLKLIYSQVTLKNVKPVLVKGNNIILTPRRTDTVYFNMNFIDCKDSAAKATAVLIPKDERQYKLNLLLEQLEKQAEELVIDNRRDTLLTCKEGTSLLIPAGSLGGSSEVTISIKEFYKKSDFVLNQLSATSNKNQLVSGGMLHITASVNGSPVDVQPGRHIRIYMTDSSAAMQQMQLFKGEKTTERLPSAIMKLNEKMEDVSDGYASTYINWIPQYLNFGKPFFDGNNNQVKVLDLRNEPIRTRETKRGTVGVFAMARDAVMSRQALKTALKEKYDYAKVKLRKGVGFLGLRRFSPDGNSLGDSAWVAQDEASRYGLAFTATRMPQQNNLLTVSGNREVRIDKNYALPDQDTVRMGSNTMVAVSNPMISVSNKLLLKVKNRYGVDINRLGWVNCDRFYNDRREKIEYVIQLGDTASNYYTMLVFDNLNSILNGYISGTKVMFSNVPVDEPVTIISIGVNGQGQPVYGMQKTLTGKLPLQGIQFEPADAAVLKSSLSKMDR
jgi:hypothetical protein